MAVYKVPQDVEADDKLIGPFSFKQFIYLMIAAMGIGIAYGLYRLLIPLAIIPVPVILFFMILALPLRKEQPMEVYLAAVVSFLTKSKVRLWRPDGIESLIEVIAPKVNDRFHGKGYSEDEVRKRLSYLADIADSHGWSVRGVGSPKASILKEELYNEAQLATDFLDETGDRAQNISNLLQENNNKRRQEIVDRMQKPADLVPAPLQTATSISYDIPGYTPSDPYQKLVSPLYTPMSAIQPASEDEDIRLVVNPYPAINQSIISPLGDQPTVSQASPSAVQPDPVVINQDDSQTQTNAPVQDAPIPPPPEPIEEPISPAIIDLAHNHGDLSIETLSREAKRLKQKELVLKENEEILISLR